MRITVSRLARAAFILLSAVLASLLLAAVIGAANTVSVQYASLSSGSSVWEINLSEDGRQIISHPGAREIWQQTGANSFVVYQNITGVQDAKSDSHGIIWFIGDGNSFGRISTPTATISYWAVPGAQEIRGFSQDSQDRLWLPDWLDSDSNLYSFSLEAGQLCTFTLPTAVNSRYAAHDSGTIWLGSRGPNRIYRTAETVTGALVSWWQMPTGIDIEPNGLAPDGGGSLWWADLQLGGLGYLDTALNELRVYSLPIGTTPQMPFLESGWIWYTESSGDTEGSIGVFDPENTPYYSATVTAGSAGVTSVCGPLQPASSQQLISRTETLAWTPPVTTSPDYSQDGWWIYKVAQEPYDLVDSGGKLFITEQSSQRLLQLTIPRFGQLHLQVTTSVSQVRHIESVTYNYSLTYESRDDSPAHQIEVQDQGCQLISGPLGDVNNDGLLDVNENWLYSCLALIPSHDDEETIVTGTVSTAVARAVDADGLEIESEQKITEVRLVHDRGDLKLIKNGPSKAAHAEALSFEYVATYSSIDHASAINVILEDDGCAPISSPIGDSDGDDRLDTGETWVYSCETSAPEHSEGEADPWISMAVLEGDNFDGQGLNKAEDQHEVSFKHTVGRLSLQKFGPSYGQHNQMVAYQFILAFQNSDRSPAHAVTLTDDKCGSASLAAGDVNRDRKLNVGEFWLFRCSYQIPPHQEGESDEISNLAVARAKNEDGKSVANGVDRHSMWIIDSSIYLPMMGS